MRVAIAGGHGAIALLLTRALTDAGHEVLSLVRNPDHGADVEAVGGRPVTADLEARDGAGLAGVIGAVDTVVFAAGAGPGSGAARKNTVDDEGAVKLLDAAVELGVGHYVMISAIGADADHPGDDVFDVYLRAKGRADDAVRSGSIPATILRPTRLTDADPEGTVALGRDARGGPITRADVALVTAEVIARGGPTGQTLDLTAGTVLVAEAVAGPS